MKKRDMFSKWRQKPRAVKVLSAIAVVLVLLIAPAAIISVAMMLIMQCGYFEVLTNDLFLIICSVTEAGIIGYFIFDFRVRGSKRVLKVNADLEDSHFMKKSEIAANKGFTCVEYKNLSEVRDGIPVYAQKRHNNIDIIFQEPIHTILIATTGTGKTQTFVSPFIEINSRTKTKPCMVITDLKGELYQQHAASLRARGYNVQVIDMRDTHHSTLWNPFGDIIRQTDEMSESVVQYRGRYQWGGYTFQTCKEAESAKAELNVRYEEDIYVDLQDLIYTMCGIDHSNDPSWQQGARDAIFGMALRFWEDYRDGYMRSDQFNIYNLWWNLTEYARGECEVLSDYISVIADGKSRADSMASTVLVSMDKTKASYLGSLNQYLHWMADGGVAQLTCANEIEFGEFDEQPTALFVIIPDEKDNRHGLASLLVIQLYKALIKKANKNKERGLTEGAELLRNCYFLMDEFGNLPKINKFEKSVTIARSRKIYFIPVIQSYKQLEGTYGKTEADQIKGNCPIKIFMGTDEQETINAISEACGKKRSKSVSYNEERGMSVSTSAKTEPLINPRELTNLNDPKGKRMGKAVVLSQGHFPILSEMTPYFELKKLFNKGVTDEDMVKKDFVFLEEDKIRYDIARTVAFLLEDGALLASSETSGGVQSDPERADDVAQARRENIPPPWAVTALNNYLKREKRNLDDSSYARLSQATDLTALISALDALINEFTERGDMIHLGTIMQLKVFCEQNYTQLVGEFEHIAL